MKYLALPCAVLAVILALCAGNAVWQSDKCQYWTAQLSTIDTLSADGQWDSAAQALSALYADWQKAQTWLHITVEHDELNDAETLFCSCMVLAEEQDSVEFRAYIAELSSALQLLREMAQLRIENVL